MPRAKRAKAYRKLMQRFGLTFGFREPYQVVVDAELIADACRFKMDLVKSLSQTLSGQVKPLITQCSMRHLYAKNKEQGVAAAIELGKTQFERRRCGHHPDQYPEPLGTLECLLSIIDPKGNGTNKNRYVVASNELEVRAAMRQVAGVPLIYITRSVMIMEPMAEISATLRGKEERGKLRAELKQTGGKRKRDQDEDEDGTQAGRDKEPEKKKKKAKGPKGPNPLSVMKSKKDQAQKTSTSKKNASSNSGPSSTSIPAATEDGSTVDKPKRKRKRKHEAAGTDGETAFTAESEAAAVEGED